MKLGRTIVVLGLLFWLQASVIPFMFYGDTQPNVILLFISLFSLYIGGKPALTASIVAGVVQDTVIGNFFGLHLFGYLLISFGFGAIRTEFEKEQWPISFLAVEAGTALVLVSVSTVLWLSDQEFQFWPYFLHVGWIQFLYQAILAIPGHLLVWSLKKENDYIW